MLWRGRCRRGQGWRRNLHFQDLPGGSSTGGSGHGYPQRASCRLRGVCRWDRWLVCSLSTRGGRSSLSHRKWRRGWHRLGVAGLELGILDEVGIKVIQRVALDS